MHTSVLGDTVYIHTYIHHRRGVLSVRFVVYPVRGMKYVRFGEIFFFLDVMD